MLKNIFFLNVDFESFFFGFSQFWINFQRPPGSKKLLKIEKNRVRGAFGTHLGFQNDFGIDFGSIRGDLGWIF